MGAIPKEQALAYYHLNPGRPTVLIFGGSQGAKGINRLILESMPSLQKIHLQVIHFTGDLNEAETVKAHYAEYKIPAAVKPFELEMQMAWSAADAFIGRSGASTVAESVEFEVPGILIPYPHATDNHQEKNADFLVNGVGSSWKLLEKNAIPGKLGTELERFFQEDQMQTFRQALKSYKNRPHQMTLCDLVLSKGKKD